MSARFEIAVIRDHEALADLRKEWAALHRQVGPGSPFEHPAWAETWARHFVRDGDLECVAVRDPERDGSLIGFAPLYRRHYSIGGLRATCVQPLGTGRGQALTEVVQLLAVRERRIDVIRAVSQHVAQLDGANWIQLSLGPEQGWLLPQWIDGDANAFVTHRRTRPCVVIDHLPAQHEVLRSRLKRNVRESIRRSRNRSAKLGDMTFRCASDVTDVEDVMPALVELHHMRARMPGAVEHIDMFRRAESIDFLVEAVTRLAEDGLARVHVAEHRGKPVAAILILSDGATDYLSVTGLDPAYWPLSLNTMLLYQALAEAVSRGRVAMNLSTGPDVAKMRWSSTITAYQEFAIVHHDRKSRWLYGASAHASLLVEHHLRARLNQVRTDSRHVRRSRPSIARAITGSVAKNPH